MFRCEDELSRLWKQKPGIKEEDSAGAGSGVERRADGGDQSPVWSCRILTSRSCSREETSPTPSEASSAGRSSAMVGRSSSQSGRSSSKSGRSSSQSGRSSSSHTWAARLLSGQEEGRVRTPHSLLRDSSSGSLFTADNHSGAEDEPLFNLNFSMQTILGEDPGRGVSSQGGFPSQGGIPSHGGVISVGSSDKTKPAAFRSPDTPSTTQFHTTGSTQFPPTDVPPSSPLQSPSSTQSQDSRSESRNLYFITEEASFPAPPSSTSASSVPLSSIQLSSVPASSIPSSSVPPSSARTSNVPPTTQSPTPRIFKVSL